MLRRIALTICLTAALVPSMAGSAPGLTAAAVTASAVLDPGRPSWATTSPHTVLHSSPTVADVNGDGTLDFVVATRDGWLYVQDLVGGSLVTLPGWPQNLGAHIGSSPTVGDLDGDGTMEIVIGVGDATDLETGHQADGGIAVYQANGSLRFFYKTAPFPETGESQVFSTPAIGDIDNNGTKDIVVASYNRFVYAIDSSGRNLPGWPFEVVDTTWSSPTLVDINHDGRLSVVVGSDFGFGGPPRFGCSSPPTNGLLMVIEANAVLRPGFPKCMNTPIWSSPAVVDLLGDGVPVAIFGTNNFLCCDRGGQDFVYAFRLTDGGAPPGWPVHLPHGPTEYAMSSPAVGDVDGDGTKEVAIGSDWGPNAAQGSLYLINRDGAIRWQKDYPNPILGSPVLADLNGDSKADVSVGVGNWNIYGYTGAGADTFFFKSESFIFNSPAVADLNRDGLNDMVVASGVGNDLPKVWVVSTTGRATPAANPWPMFRRNSAHTGTDIVPTFVPPRYNFDEYLLLANAGDLPANGTISLQLPTGAPVPVPFTVAPHSRLTVPVDASVSKSEVSAKIDSDRPIVAERAMYFAYGPARWTGGHATHGSPSPSTDWFLAEGFTAPNFDTYVLIQNPLTRTVDATVTLMKPGGATTNSVLNVPAQSRRTLNVKSVPGFESSEVSFRVHATGPVVVERSMYFDYGGRTGGHDAMGVQALAKDWFLAEGYTAEAFDTYVLVANPNDTPATVTYTFLRPAGGPITTSRVVPPHSRGTIRVDDESGLSASEVSTKVSADIPIAVERAMYFSYRGLTGGHDAEGVTGLGTDWFLAEGYTGPGFDTYVLLANPAATDASVNLAYLLEDGSVQNQALTLPAQSRRTVHVNDVVPGRGFSTHVTVANGVGISVERAMYFLYAGIWDGGHDSQATAVASRTWYFAEGYTGP